MKNLLSSYIFYVLLVNLILLTHKIGAQEEQPNQQTPQPQKQQHQHQTRQQRQRRQQHHQQHTQHQNQQNQQQQNLSDNHQQQQQQQYFPERKGPIYTSLTSQSPLGHFPQNLRHFPEFPTLQPTVPTITTTTTTLPPPPTTLTPNIFSNHQEIILKRIYDGVASLELKNNNQATILEKIGNTLDAIDKKFQDKLDELHNEIEPFTRKIQNLEWMIGRMESDISQLRNDYDATLHDNSDYRNRIYRSNIGKRNEQSSDFSTSSSLGESSDELDCSQKLDALATLLTSTRSAINKLEKQTNSIQRNVTNIFHITSDIAQRQNGMPTKKFLHGALNSLRSVQPSCYNSNPLLVGVGRTNAEGDNGITSLPASCSHAAEPSTGVHRIQLNRLSKPFFVMCDDDTEDGGWTVILNRYDGTINFNRNWLEYKNGFGNIAGEYFIGLDKLHEMTTTMLHELLIILEDFDGMKKYAKYKLFAIDGENQDYALRLLGEYSGDAGDSLSYSASYKFSTFDNDNDGWVEGNCALAHTGAWWYNACEMSNLNGKYLGGAVSDTHTFQGMYWNDFRGPKYSLKSAKMLIRPVDRIFL